MSEQETDEEFRERVKQAFAKGFATPKLETFGAEVGRLTAAMSNAMSPLMQLSGSTLQKLAEQFGVDVNQFVTEEPAPTEEDLQRCDAMIEEAVKGLE